MKLAFIIPLLDDYDVELAYKNIEKSCVETKVSFDIIFALSNKMSGLFTKIRNVFVEKNNVKAFMTDRPVNEHKLITLAMEHADKYDATVVYSGKEDTNVDVIKAFITSWQSGNKIVYLRKVYRGFAKFTHAIKKAFYNLGIFIVGVFKDINAENDIQLLDNDVVKTINQLPNKNQLLRTLDSLIYYSTDIIHLQVDPNEYINPLYNQKSKKYYTNLTVSLIALALSLIGLVSAIFVATLAVKVGFILHFVLWVSFVAFLITSIIFSTRKNLSVRVGEEFEISELKTIKSKTEFYNF